MLWAIWNVETVLTTHTLHITMFWSSGYITSTLFFDILRGGCIPPLQCSMYHGHIGLRNCSTSATLSTPPFRQDGLIRKIDFGIISFRVGTFDVKWLLKELWRAGVCFQWIDLNGFILCPFLTIIVWDVLLIGLLVCILTCVI